MQVSTDGLWAGFRKEQVVIDALGTEAVARQVRRAVSTVASKPIRYLISSTFHKPFTGGNAVYADVLRIGHEATRSDLAKLLEADPPERDTRAALHRHWQLLKDVREAVQDQVKSGAKEAAALRAIQLPQYRNYKGYQRALEIAVHRIYREMTVGLP